MLPVTALEAWMCPALLKQ